MTKATGKGRQGFASMPTEKQRAIATMGGRAAHAAGLAHRFTHDEAVKAGKIGGSRPRRKRKTTDKGAA